MKEPLGIIETVLVSIWILATWGVVFWWIGRRNRKNPERTSVPIGLIPVAYVLTLLNPAVEYLLYKMNLRRSERIRTFLKLANDLRMRKKPINGFFPRWPRR